MMKLLPIHEVFHTFQGEGLYMGSRAFFVRTFGCPLHCPWCDSAGTWHKDFIPKSVDKYTPDELKGLVEASGARICVITGGEPAIHDLTEFTTALSLADISTHLETSGAFELRGVFDWVTLSPKVAKLPIQSSVAVANEIKLIIDSVESVEYWNKWLLKNMHILTQWDRLRAVWLHPEWSQKENPDILNAISERVKRDATGLFRAGYQLHKLYNVDSRDNRSRKLVPLGGNEALGY